MIEIHDYNPRWPEEFRRIASELTNALGEHALGVEHIGSTSVPGMAAKDVIDIQVTVASLSDEIVGLMVEAGFEHCAHLNSDHLPPGSDADPWNWSKLVFCERRGDRRSNIHVRVHGAANQRYALLFRDYLRARPPVVEAMSRMKRALAGKCLDDVGAYYAVKDPAYDLIWCAAQEVGPPDDSD